MRPVAGLRSSLAIAGLMLVFAAARTVAAEPAATADAPRFDPQTAGKVAYGLLTNPRFAYRGRPLDAEMLDAALAYYLDALDPGRMLFTEADVQAFRADRDALEAAASVGDFALPRAVLARFREHEAARAAFVRARLGESDGLGASGEWIVDRSRAPRPRDAAERETLWRQALANDALDLALAGFDDARVRDALRLGERARAERSEALTPERADAEFIAAFVRAVDPAARYLTPETLQSAAAHDDLRIIGMGLSFERRGAFVVVHGVVPGGPAAASGAVFVGDRVLAVGEGDTGPMQPAAGLDLPGVVALTRGQAGSVVRLQLLAADAPVGDRGRLVTLTRREVDLPDGRLRTSIVDAGGRRIGVLDLDSFYTDFDATRRDRPEAVSASRDILRALEGFRAQRVDAALLDLRGNGGGALLEAVQVAALFLGDAPVVQIREAGGRVSIERVRDADPAWTGPVAVLVDEGSAAASEIVAAALRDHGRGPILGARSFGRGSVQSLLSLDRAPQARGRALGAVQMTVAMLYRPDGRSLEGEGLVPDVAIGPPAPPRPPRVTALPAGPRIAAAPELRPARGEALTTATTALDAAQATRLARDPEASAWYEAERTRQMARIRERLPLDPAARRALVLPPRPESDVALRLAARVLADIVDQAAADGTVR